MIIPREHGAYAQLAVPLATALYSGLFTVPACLLAAAAILAFLAHEPLLVALGHRGARARANAPHAARAAGALGTAAAIAAAIGIALGSSDARVAVAIVAIPATVLVGLAWWRAERSAAAEIVAAIALSGASYPVAIAGSAPHAAASWASWAIGFSCAVVAVHRVLARHRRRASTMIDRFITTAFGAIVIGVATWHVAAMPLPATAAITCAVMPRATYLRAIGVLFVAASLATGVLLV